MHHHRHGELLCFNALSATQRISHLLSWSKRPASQHLCVLAADRYTDSHPGKYTLCVLAADRYTDSHPGKYTLCVNYDNALQLQSLHVMHHCDHLLLHSASTIPCNAQAWLSASSAVIK